MSLGSFLGDVGVSSSVFDSETRIKAEESFLSRVKGDTLETLVQAYDSWNFPLTLYMMAKMPLDLPPLVHTADDSYTWSSDYTERWDGVPHSFEAN